MATEPPFEVLVRETVKYTASGHGYYRVLVEGEEVSKHTTEREALESAANHYEDGLDVRVIHDYEVKVVKNAKGKIVRVRLKTHSLKLNTPMAIVTYTSPSLGTSNPDSVPDSFSFATQTDVAIATEIISEYITVTGTTLGAAISISGANNPFYEINGSGWTQAAGTIYPGQTVRVKHESSAFNGQSIISTLTIGGVQGTFTSTTQAAAGADPYDLYATDTNSRGTIPFTVTWPTEPTILNTYNVPSELSFAAALSTPNAQFTVAAGSYGSLTPAANHQHWILDDAATFTGLTVDQRNNIKIVGGTFTIGGDCLFASGGSSDLYYENLNVTCGGLGWVSGGDRIALIHNTVIAGQYAIFQHEDGAAVGVYYDDIIFAGNYFSGGNSANQSPFRIQGTRNGIFVDNRVNNAGGNRAFRAHYGCANHWYRRNMSDEGVCFLWGSTANPSLPNANQLMGDFWMYDFEVYGGIGLREVSDGGWPGILRSDGNIAYTVEAGDNSWSFLNPQAQDIIGTNTILPPQAAPALGAWLTARGIQPGADH